MLVLIFASDTIYYMNQDTSTSQNLPSRIIPDNNQVNNQQHHYKRIIVAVTIALIAIVVVVFALIYISKKTGMGDKALRARYQTEQEQEAKAVFENLEKNKTPMTDADKKNLEAFFKSSTSTKTAENQELKAFFETSTTQSEQSYQEWKAKQPK
jgi:uncharacterized membrane protein YhiD involved in acid resistance